MQDPVLMTEIQTFHGHEHPALDVSRLKDKVLVLDDCFEIRVQVLEDQVEVGFGGEDV